VKYYIVIVIIVISLAQLVSSYIKYSTNNIYDSCENELEIFLSNITINENVDSMKEYLNFECDGFYIIAPYTTTKYKEEIVGCEWYFYSNYSNYLFNELILKGDNLLESQQQLVFVKDNKVVSVAVIERRIGDFIFLEELFYDIDTMFKSEIPNSSCIFTDGYSVIVND
jgi:hypothetical protein